MKLKLKLDLTNWKRWVWIGLAVVLVLDLALVVFLWRAAGSDRAALENRRNLLRTRYMLQVADIKRATEIRQNMPQAERESTEFYTTRLHTLDGGYSSLLGDFDAISKKAGITVSSLAFKQNEIAGRNVVEIGVTATVEGDYPALVRFINGLERSDSFYLLDNLGLASGSTGGIRLNLNLRTYLRCEGSCGPQAASR